MTLSLDQILERIEAGERVRIVRAGKRGPEWVEIPQGWLPFGRRIDVTREEIGRAHV